MIILLWQAVDTLVVRYSGEGGSWITSSMTYCTATCLCLLSKSSPQGSGWVGPFNSNILVIGQNYITGQFALQTTRHAFIQLLASNLQMVSVGLLWYIALRCIIVLRGGTGGGALGGNCLTVVFPGTLVSNYLCCSVYQKSCLQCSNFHKLHFAIYLLTKSRQMGEGGWDIRWNDSGAQQGRMGFK